MPVLPPLPDDGPQPFIYYAAFRFSLLADALDALAACARSSPIIDERFQPEVARDPLAMVMIACGPDRSVLASIFRLGDAPCFGVQVTSSFPDRIKHAIRKWPMKNLEIKMVDPNARRNERGAEGEAVRQPARILGLDGQPDDSGADEPRDADPAGCDSTLP